MSPRPRPRPLPHRVLSSLAATGIVVALVGACSSDSGRIASVSTVTPSTPPSTSPAIDTSAPPVTAPPTSAAPTTELDGESDVACGVLAPLMDGARVLSSIEVDWLGTGTADATATVYETAPDTADYRLRVERDGAGSEIAIIMGVAPLPDEATSTSADPVAGAPVTGEPALLAAVQVDGTGTPSTASPNPQELIVRVATVPPTGSGYRESSSGYDVAIFFNNRLLPEGCLARFKGADGLELVLPIRSGGWAGSPKAGLACENNPASSAVTDYLVRTTAEREPGKNTIFLTHDIVLVRGGSAGAPASSSSEQLLDGEDTAGRVKDYGGPTGPLMRYSSLSGCTLGTSIAVDEPTDDGTVDTVDEALAD